MKAIIRLLSQLYHHGGEICCLLKSIDSRLMGIQTTLNALLADVQDDGATGTGTPENTSAIVDATASLKSHADALTSATTAAEASDQPLSPQPQP